MIYKKYCVKCRKETLHRVVKINLKRGVKLCCLKCCNENKNYYNVNRLKEAEINSKELKGGI